MLLRSITASTAVRRLRPLVNAPIRACIHANICDIDTELRSDVKKLGKALGIAIKQNDSEVFDIVEELRALGREVGMRFFDVLYIVPNTWFFSVLLHLSGDCPTEKRLRWMT